MSLLDKFGRQITDLRISITDRCNFRCVYCRSADPENYRDHDEILSWPELDRLAGIFLNLGIRKSVSKFVNNLAFDQRVGEQFDLQVMYGCARFEKNGFFADPVGTWRGPFQKPGMVNGKLN